ncbi:MAG: recombinase family protein, partial [Clostridia bacterium]|nr:recombinase family protein [Clostridia bacterium]
MKAQNGELRNTVFPIFGYTYNDAFERIPDAETAPIVQLIYKKLLEFGSTGMVAKYLTEQKIKTPRYYNADAESDPCAGEQRIGEKEGKGRGRGAERHEVKGSGEKG